MARIGRKDFPHSRVHSEALKAKSVVLDMEAVILNEEGKSSFQALQAALGGEGNAEAIVAFVFDVLHVDGTDLTKLPLIERKEQLEALLKRSKQDVLRYSGHVAGQGAESSYQSLQDGVGRNRLKGQQCAVCGGASKNLAEDQMRSPAGVHHSWLQ